MKKPEIPIPKFRKIQLPCRTLKPYNGFSELQFELKYEALHRPLEISEKRARKREEEIDRYMRYIVQLKAQAPELWPRV